MKGLIFLLLLFNCLLGCNDHPAFKTGLEGKLMPSFNLLLMDSTSRLNTNSIPGGQPIILLYFSPNCPYCRAQIQEIISDIKSLSNIQFYILSSFPFDQIKTYYNNNQQLKRYSNITVCQDYNFYFGNYFKTNGVPYMAVYEKNKRLKQVIAGNVSTNVIKDIVHE
ncbi:hypothetical protein A3860_30510 [Niastella vici]|uniref:Thioredoxin-like fold domain-containing protein n=1 Tax=Niastella vici TaxID=1703345 RepID=A0A1V9FUN8_9BACT|nr:thioredoxin family protein [Niastella vici]OQP62018.1 hypothetical protein A3860_30510 [Niastella vici]